MAPFYLRTFFLVYGMVVLSGARRTVIKEEEWTQPNHRVPGTYYFPYTLNLRESFQKHFKNGPCKRRKRL